MTVLLKKIFISSLAYLMKRNIYLTSSFNISYEPEGKTTVTILNKNFDYGLMIDNVSEQGFILNNGIRTIGPMIIFPKTMISWNIASSINMNQESFSLFLTIEPKLDILVIGLDDEYPYNTPFLLNIKDIFKKYKISTEILPVYRACATFNFLNAEKRYTAAALVPPKIKYAEDLLLQNNVTKYSIESDINKKSLTDLNKDKIQFNINEENDKKIIHNVKYNELNAEILARNKDIEESFKTQSPWKEAKTKVKNSDIEDKNKTM